MEIEIGHHVEAGHSGSLNRMIAITVALLSAFIAISKLKDENVVLKMHRAETQAVDTWNQYQAKRMREYLSQIGQNQAQVFRSVAKSEAMTLLDSQFKGYEQAIAHYKSDEKELSEKAKGYEESYEQLHAKHELFDLSDAALSISLAILAVAALTQQRALLGVSWALAGVGVVTGGAGLLGLNLHLDWITRLF